MAPKRLIGRVFHPAHAAPGFTTPLLEFRMHRIQNLEVYRDYPIEFMIVFFNLYPLSYAYHSPP